MSNILKENAPSDGNLDWKPSANSGDLLWLELFYRSRWKSIKKKQFILWFFLEKKNFFHCRFHEQLEAEEKAAKIGTEIIPWQISDADKVREQQSLNAISPIWKMFFPLLYGEECSIFDCFGQFSHRCPLVTSIFLISNSVFWSLLTLVELRLRLEIWKGSWDK